ncbi:MAG: hypothetical protein IT477_10370 [Rhodanobacteraceae bacterium]|nr:hypothetical protein [Rhodanobacteraceae bacterium]
MSVEDLLQRALNPETPGDDLVAIFNGVTSRASVLNEHERRVIHEAVLLNPALPLAFLLDPHRNVADFRHIVRRPSWPLEVLAEPLLDAIRREIEQSNVADILLHLPNDLPPRALSPLLADLKAKGISTPVLDAMAATIARLPSDDYDALRCAFGLVLEWDDLEDNDNVRFFLSNDTHSASEYVVLILDETQGWPRAVGTLIDEHLIPLEVTDAYGVQCHYVPLGTEER